MDFAGSAIADLLAKINTFALPEHMVSPRKYSWCSFPKHTVSVSVHAGQDKLLYCQSIRFPFVHCTSRHQSPRGLPRLHSCSVLIGSGFEGHVCMYEQ